ncbi:MAG TPA: HEAT repeat domain-containing protein [Pyrinomonadaceae bacterium]|nr:HEAT repeat domain-containing protein [Pyrinomonadaceae bacterium]
MPVWSKRLDYMVFDVAISSDGNTIVGAAGPSVSVFDSAGNLLWTTETRGICLSVSVSHDGQLIVVSSSLDGVRLYDRAGQPLQQLISYGQANSVSMAADGSCVAVALSTANTVKLLSTNGKGELWRYWISTPASVAVNVDGSLVAIGAEGGVSLHDSRGELLQRFLVAGRITGLALDGAGAYLAASANDRSELTFFSADGTVSWTKQLSNSSLRVAVSDGGAVVACADVHHVRLFERDGSELINSRFEEEFYAVALTADGSSMVVSGSEGIKYLRTSLRFEPATELAANGTAILEIRRRYLDFAPAGLCSWFKEFDRYLKEERYETCDALLEEIDGGGYELDATEAAYVSSRRGALALSRGITHELEKQFDDADRLYRVALEFHVGCGNREGEGQVRALLGAGGDQGLRELLAQQFKQQLKVLGSGEASLTRRVEEAATPELLRLLEAAKDAGHAEPLLTVLNGERQDHFSGATNAVAALEHLKPGAAIDEVLKLLEHPGWFVRWRACELIKRFAAEHESTPDIHRAVTRALQRETDPDVRFELLRLIIEGVGNAVTDDLLSLLQDPDPNVRYGTCIVLGEFGTRNAIPALREVPAGQTSFGEVSDAAEAAIEQINERAPKSPCEAVILYNPKFEAAVSVVVKSHFFLPTEPVLHGAIFVRDSPLISNLLVKQEVVGRSVFVLRFYSASVDDHGDFSLARLEDDLGDENRKRFKFTLRSPSEGWQPGENHLHIYFDDEYIDTESFEILNSITVRQCLFSQTINSAGIVTNPGNVFLQNTALMYGQILVDRATFGVSYGLSIVDKHGNLLRNDQAVGQMEGQQRVLFEWAGTTFEPGTYTVRIDTGGLGEHRSSFEVIPAIRATSVGIYQNIDSSGTPSVPLSGYHPHEDFVYASNVVAPANASIYVDLRYGDQLVFGSAVNCVTRWSGEQTATFVFRKPAAEWPLGKYAVTLRVNDVHINTRSFQVTAVPLLQKVGTVVGRTGDLVLDVAKPIAKSALVWGVKLPILVMVFFLLDALLAKVAGREVVNSARLPSLATTIGQSSLFWTGVIGVIFGVVQTLIERRSERLARVLKIALLIVFNMLVAQQATYLVFGLGYIWPNALGQLFSKVLFATPIVAWLMTFFTIRFLDPTFMSQKGSFAFSLQAIGTSVFTILFYLSGLITSVTTGLFLVVILWIVGWASTGWTIGVYVGFIFGLVGVLSNLWDQRSAQKQ